MHRVSSVNKSPDFWWVHFHPISHFCSVVNHGKTKFVTLDYIVKKFSLFYDSPLIRGSVTPALISWNIPKGKFPKGSYKNILWRKKIETSAYGLRFSNFLEWTQMEFMILLHRYSLLDFYDTRMRLGQRKNPFFVSVKLTNCTSF